MAELNCTPVRYAGALAALFLAFGVAACDDDEATTGGETESGTTEEPAGETTEPSG